jgi:acetyl esterase/lipase
MRILLVAAMGSLIASTSLPATTGEGPLATGTVIPLWPEGVPGRPRPAALHGRPDLGPEVHTADGHVSNVAVPTMTYFAPAVDRPNGTAVIICPGGGYINLSYEREGVQFANWLGTLGVASFVLKYRLVEYGHPAPLQDVLRAIRIVRSRAREFHINPDRIGVMGSSAGGHLAASAGTLFDHAAGRTGAPLDAVSARPDFLLLMYPVITMDDPSAHAGSREALLGPRPSRELLQLLSVEQQVTSATPPTLLIHTQDDQAVPVENSVVFFQALTLAKVPAEMYLFQHGEHGMGMRAGLGTASDWPARAAEWLRARGLLSPARS